MDDRHLLVLFVCKHTFLCASKCSSFLPNVEFVCKHSFMNKHKCWSNNDILKVDNVLYCRINRSCFLTDVRMSGNCSERAPWEIPKKISPLVLCVGTSTLGIHVWSKTCQTGFGFRSTPSVVWIKPSKWSIFWNMWKQWTTWIKYLNAIFMQNWIILEE